ncbi:A-kinase anchor protein 17A-like [Ruditapes philippinarum]|uniref:A-kinase anchor protein 17A-like n=1 Tax=Ruditapes philippinarum TaxID=129788 RepID=UPI00295BE82C|nr:A-kinase anchor protein 17A-like [Ruditapes philippinarum]
MATAGASICTDSSDAIELYQTFGLYLKPIARVNVCVQLPPLKEAGKSISNWEVMERIKAMIKPHSFTSLKIIKSTMEFIRFEGEAENKDLVTTIMQRLEGKSIKLSGFHEQLKVKAGEAKIQFPSRHDWDSYFRDAKNMNEMRPGERPDTLYIRDTPTRWFASRHCKEKDKPSEEVLKRVFCQFGEIRCVDIPMLDPYRKEMSGLVKSGSIQTFTFGQDLVFDCYVQFKEYIGFVKAMDRFRGMKLLYMDEDDKCAVANIKVDFDKTKHLSDKAIRKRRLERERLEQLEKEREERVRREREEQDRKVAEEKRLKDEEEMERDRKRQEKLQRREDRRKEREDKRKQKYLEQKRFEEEKKMQLKIALEERKFMLNQRKLESLRLLTELFERVKVIKVKEDLEKKEIELEEERKRQVDLEKQRKDEEMRKKKEAIKKKKEQLKRQEQELREKILKNWKHNEEHKQEQMREELRKKLSGKTKLKSAVVMRR